MAVTVHYASLGTAHGVDSHSVESETFADAVTFEESGYYTVLNDVAGEWVAAVHTEMVTKLTTG